MFLKNLMKMYFLTFITFVAIISVISFNGYQKEALTAYMSQDLPTISK